MKPALAWLCTAVVVGCADDPAPVAVTPDVPQVETPQPAPFVVVTFNTGSGPDMLHDDGPDDGYTAEHAALTDTWYGNGLAFLSLVEDARLYFEGLDPDLVVFQEIFWSGECPQIPEEARAGFVCETWAAGMPTVAQVVLGDGWQVACHPGKPDKCAAVNRRFGTFRGCDGDLCLEGMDGFGVEGCGNGARVARIVGDREAGEPITLINFHGSSGLTEDDFDCRARQIDQVFVDFGDGTPGVSGTHNLVMGDLNTDPVLLLGADKSADRWTDFVGPGKAFVFHSDRGEDAPASYGGVFNIDHVMSDAFTGACVVGGLDGEPAVTEARFFDHKPVVCTLSD